MPGDREDVLVGDGVAEAFAGSLDSAKALVAVVSSLFNGKKDQHAHIVVNANGVRISVENQAKSLHAVAYVKPAMFTSFTYYGDPDHMDSDGGDEEGESAGVVNASTQFRVNLASLLDCLTVFGSSDLGATSLHIGYVLSSRTLRLMLEEGGVLTECEIRTIPAGDELDFPTAFRRSRILNKAWIRSEYLREAFIELSDLRGASTVTLYMAPHAPHLQLSASGNAGSCTVDFPMGSESFMSFDSEREQLFNYHLSLLQFAFRGLAKAEESFLRINEDGMLNLHHRVVQQEDGEDAFVSFIMLPDETEAGSQAQGDIPASDDSDVKRYATLGARNAQRHEDAVASSWMTADPDGSSQGSRPPTVASTPSSVVLSQ